MRITVVGHGGSAAGETFLPPGVSVHFYAEPGHDLPFGLGLEILRRAADGHGFEHGVSVYDGSTAPNQRLVRLADPELAAVLTATAGDAHAVGDDLPSTVQLCSDPSGDVCDPVHGEHHCSGLLGDLLGVGDMTRHGVTVELHLVCCRATSTGGPITLRLPGEDPLQPAHHTSLDLTAKQFRELGGVDRAAFFDGLDQDTRDQLVNGWTSVRDWSAVRNALRFLHSESDLGFYEYYLSRPPQEREILEDDPDVARVLAWVEDYIDRFGQAILTGDAELMWAQLDDDLRRRLLNIAQLLDLRSPSVAGWILSAATTSSPVLEWGDIDRHNASVLYGAADGQDIPFTLSGWRLALGDDPAYWEAANVLAGENGSISGTLRLRKPMYPDSDPRTTGVLRVAGTVLPALEEAVGRLNAHGIVFVTLEEATSSSSDDVDDGDDDSGDGLYYEVV